MQHHPVQGETLAGAYQQGFAHHDLFHGNRDPGIVSPHRGHGPRGRLVAARLIVRGVLSGEAVASLYTCLLCGACRLACPAGIDVPLLVRAARQAVARAWRNR